METKDNSEKKVIWVIWMRKVNNDASRFVRWDAIRRNHLTATISLFIGASTFALGFLGNLIIDNDGKFNTPELVVLVLTVSLFFASVAFGSIATLSRLMDFRLTAKKIRMRREGAKGTDLVEMLMDWLGRITWTLFLYQCVTFLLGGLLFVFIIIGFLFKRIA